MDPVKGSVRRMSALDSGRAVARQMTDLVEPVRGRVGDQVTNTADRFKSRVG